MPTDPVANEITFAGWLVELCFNLRTKDMTALDIADCLNEQIAFLIDKPTHRLARVWLRRLCRDGERKLKLTYSQMGYQINCEAGRQLLRTLVDELERKGEA